MIDNDVLIVWWFDNFIVQKSCLVSFSVFYSNKQFKTEYVDDLKHILEDKTRIVQGIIFEGCEFSEIKTDK